MNPIVSPADALNHKSVSHAHYTNGQQRHLRLRHNYKLFSCHSFLSTPTSFRGLGGNSATTRRSTTPSIEFGKGTRLRASKAPPRLRGRSIDFGPAVSRE